jgi:hypothetical protein
MDNIFYLLSLIQLMLDVNSWKVVKRMTKQYYHSYKEFKVEISSMSKRFSLLWNLTWRKKSNASEQGSHCFHYGNYAQIPNKFHLLFVHDDNKSNSDQIGQVVAMGGSG